MSTTSTGSTRPGPNPRDRTSDSLLDCLPSPLTQPQAHLILTAHTQQPQTPVAQIPLWRPSQTPVLLPSSPHVSVGTSQLFYLLLVSPPAQLSAQGPPTAAACTGCAASPCSSLSNCKDNPPPSHWLPCRRALTFGALYFDLQRGHTSLACVHLEGLRNVGTHHAWAQARPRALYLGCICHVMHRDLEGTSWVLDKEANSCVRYSGTEGSPSSLDHCLLTWHLVATVGDIEVVGARLIGDVLYRTAAILIVHAGHLSLRGSLHSQAQAAGTSSPGPNKSLSSLRVLRHRPPPYPQ